jgi:hypothetical protein
MTAAVRRPAAAERQAAAASTPRAGVAAGAALLAVAAVAAVLLAVSPALGKRGRGPAALAQMPKGVVEPTRDMGRGMLQVSRSSTVPAPSAGAVVVVRAR